MHLLGRYLSRRFLAYFTLVLMALAALALTLDLMEQADQVVESGRGGVIGLTLYALLRLPDLAAQMLPASTLLAMLMVLGQSLRSGEMVALWSSGVSPGWLMAALLPVALLVAALNFLNNDVAVPETREVLRQWGLSEARKGGFLADAADTAWLLSGPDIVHVHGAVEPDGTLSGITIFRRDPEGRLLERIDAARAVPAGDSWVDGRVDGGVDDGMDDGGEGRVDDGGEGWELQQVTRHQVDPAATLTLPRMLWQGRIDLDALPLIASDRRELTSGQLLRLIANEGYGQRPADRFRTWLHARIASIFLPALMIFLVVSLAQRFRRTSAFGGLLLSSLSIGFAYFALDGICIALGESGLLPAWFAAWSPKLALASVIGSLLVYREG